MLDDFDTRYSLIRPQMRESVIRYVCMGYPPGGFMRALLRNNLTEAAAAADHENASVLHSWALVLVNVVPMQARGQDAIIDEWVEARRTTPIPIDEIKWPDLWGRDVQAMMGEVDRAIEEAKSATA